MATYWLQPSAVTVERRYLVWEIEHKHYIHVLPGKGMLEQFARLENAPDAEIARFARRWGILKVGRLKLPGLAKRQWHLIDHLYSHRDITKTRRLRDNSAMQAREPLYVWRYWIPRFAAVLRCASEIQENRHPPAKDWELITGTRDMSQYDPKRDQQTYGQAYEEWIQRGREFIRKHPGAPIPVENLKEPDEPVQLGLYRRWRLGRPEHVHEHGTYGVRCCCFEIISNWQEIAKVELFLNASSNRIEVTTHGLFAGLVWQLMAAVCSCDGVAVCSECTRIYVPKRKPSGKTRNYCPTCRKSGAPIKNAVRDFRARQQEKTKNAKT